MTEAACIHHAIRRARFQGKADGTLPKVNEQADRDFDARGRVVSVALTATNPGIMLTGPGPASPKALRKAALTIDHSDLADIDEPSASACGAFGRLRGPDARAA